MERLVQRDDDRPDVIKQRLDTYRAETEPVIEAYRRTGELIQVDGSGTPDEVFERVTHGLATVTENS
jgi:adenylate kinase